MDNIVDFSGIAPFIDTPVKRYSSGMQARLGFAIAAHLNPDVLFIDEVLSVGDMEFQQRCVNRMLEFKRAGVTIVFVSHDLNAVARLCDRALLLRGAVVAIGDTADILETHVRASMQGGAASSPEISISRVVLSDEAGSATAVARPGDALRVSVAYQIHAEMSDLQFGFVVHRSTDDMVVYDESVTQQALGLSRLASGTTLMLDFAFTANLTRGHYYIELHTYRATTARFPIRLRPAVTFEVKESRSYAGVAHLDLEVRPSTVREPAVAAARGVSAAREAEKLSVS